jgi:hypothetical protein
MEHEDKKDKKENTSELTDLILNIIDYYSFKNDMKEEVEKWKAGTKYDNDENLIPSDIDSKVKELFIIRIKNLIKKGKTQ